MWSRLVLGAFILSLPISVFRNVAPDTTPEDTVRTRLQRYEPGETRLTVTAGGGRYGVIESCEGSEISRTIVRQKDVAGEIEHRFGRHVGIGVRGGEIHEEGTTTVEIFAPPTVTSGERTNRYVNPYLRLAGRGFELSGGGLYSTEPFLVAHRDPMHARFSAGIALGSLSKVVLRGSWMEGTPLLDEGGYLSVGAEFVPRAPLDVYIGTTAAGPQDDFGGVVRLQCWVTRFASLKVSGMIGNSEAVQSYGVTAGLTLRMRPPEAEASAVRHDTHAGPIAPPTPPDSSRRSP